LMRTRVLLGVLALVSLVAVFTTRVSRKMPDFEVYHRAGARALAAEPLYRTEDGHFQFKYLPAFAILAAPLAMVPLPAAKGAWLATRRNRAAFVTMVAALVMLLLLPVARYGWHGNLWLLGDWWHTVTSTTASNIINPDNVSLSAMFTRWLGPGSPTPLLAAAT